MKKHKKELKKIGEINGADFLGYEILETNGSKNVTLYHTSFHILPFPILQVEKLHPIR